MSKMETAVMGKLYFELNDTTETHEQLINFFTEDLGFELIKNKPLGNETYFNRVSQFTDNNGLVFDVIWYKNLANLRFGEWGKAFFECSFNKIIGSYIPNCDHITLDFLNNGKRTMLVSVSK